MGQRERGREEGGGGRGCAFSLASTPPSPPSYSQSAKSIVDPVPNQIKATGANSIFNKELSMARKVGAAYKTKNPTVKQPGDPFSSLNATEAAIWRKKNNNTKALAAVGVLTGANINMTGLPASKTKSFNLYKENQAELLALDAQKLNLTREAFPTNTGYDWLRPVVDKLTSAPIDDRVAPALSYLEFRDPVLGEIANAKTVVGGEEEGEGEGGEGGEAAGPRARHPAPLPPSFPGLHGGGQ